MPWQGRNGITYNAIEHLPTSNFAKSFSQAYQEVIPLAMLGRCLLNDYQVLNIEERMEEGRLRQQIEKAEIY